MPDRYDSLIIEQLTLDARQPVSAIAEKVNLSRSAVSDRIKKLEKQGTIKGYQVLLSESQKSEVSAFLEVKHTKAKCREVAPLFKAIPEVKSCHGISGHMDLMVFVRAASMQRLHEIREYFDSLPEIEKVITHVVLSEWVNR